MFSNLLISKRVFLASVLSLVFVFALGTAYAAPSVEGQWKTVDDKTHKPKGIVQLWVSNGVLYGKLVDRFKENIQNPEDTCTKCTGNLKGKPIIGLVFLYGLKMNSDGSWSGGSIVDPETGKIYKCSVNISPDGKELHVRGYIGVSLLGRTQTWYRAK